MRRLLIILLLCAGCAQVHPPARSPLSLPSAPEDNILFSQSVGWCQAMWRAEAQKRFPDPIMVFGHGRMLFGEWCIQPDDYSGNLIQTPVPVTWIVRYLRWRHPNRDIVLIICNPKHVTIAGGSVWYAPDDIWLVPDDFLEYFDFARGDEKAVGNIDGFIFSGPSPAMVPTESRGNAFRPNIVLP